MRLTCTVSRLPTGKWVARHNGSSTGQFEVTAPTRDEVLTSRNSGFMLDCLTDKQGDRRANSCTDFGEKNCQNNVEGTPVPRPPGVATDFFR
jgi:hypothetical protein